jgi:PqqD family protein of HPr-rel-A system
MSVRFLATDGIRFLHFEDESIVFNPTSWDAHFLNAAAAAILELLDQGPHSVEDVELLLGEVLHEAEQGAASDHALSLLHEFEQLGLVYLIREGDLAGG